MRCIGSAAIPISSQPTLPSSKRGVAHTQAKAKKVTRRRPYFSFSSNRRSRAAAGALKHTAGKAPRQQPKRNLFFSFSPPTPLLRALRSLQPDILAISRSRKQKDRRRRKQGQVGITEAFTPPPVFLFCFLSFFFDSL